MIRMTLKHLLFTAALLGSAAEAQTLKISSLAPEGSVWMVEMRAAAEQIEQRTDGRVNFRFYGGGVQGNDNQVRRKIRIGQLHGATFTSGELGDFTPAAVVYALPMTFNDMDEVLHVRGKLDTVIRQALEDEGKVNFGFAGAGFVYLMSNTPVASLDDMSRQKTWVQEGNEVAYGAFKALGISPVSMPLTDVLTGLQTELLDSVSMSPMGAVVLQLHTRLKYITDLPLAYVYGTLVIEEKYFSGLSAADQAVVRSVMEAAYRKLDEESISDDREAFQALQEAGLKVVETAPAEVSRWRDRVVASNRDLAEQGIVSRQLMDEMLRHLANYRAGRP
jgi:TRAP-type C4-dicarboxylate transport system substrate-binding protein